MPPDELAKSRQPAPVLLLKTKSSPVDAYEQIFSHPPDRGRSWEPIFLPVLEHKFEDDGMAHFRSILGGRRIGAADGTRQYGGLVFTSQRAVEAFAKLLQDGRADGDAAWPHLQGVPVYSVGPATTRALRAIPQNPPLEVFGEHTGNGDSLAQFILEHYGGWYKEEAVKPSLLFPVGEQRRDIIPKTLMDENLPSDGRIQVDEITVYGTGVMESFASDFRRVLDRTADQPARWVIVFSPTGCDSMLHGLGLLDGSSGKARPKEPRRTTFVATIGPTTRDYLIKTFNFEPDVCAEKPSPEGVWAGIEQFMEGLTS